MKEGKGSIGEMEEMGREREHEEEFPHLFNPTLSTNKNIWIIANNNSIQKLHINNHITYDNSTRFNIHTGWPNKNRTFFEIPYFCSHYRYNHAVFAEVFRNYSRKQATVF